jgi:hypothetical protein
MPVKLTQKEKNLRGTAQKCRAAEARSLRAIRKDIRELERLISDMNFNLDIARKSVRTEGALIEVLVTNSNGNFEKTRRLNPTFKIQRDALTALKSLNRQLTILREEETQARGKEQQANTRSEFAVD